MSERVLFVDDEPQVLDGIQRSLRKHIDVQTAASGADGLRLLAEAGPFALVVSDMRMPNMDGAQFLAKAREKSPDTVRMILSGQADLEATIAAVNEGHIYRFLSKPCPADKLLAAIEDGLNQHRLLTAEKVLLEQTLSGCVTMSHRNFSGDGEPSGGVPAAHRGCSVTLSALAAAPGSFRIDGNGDSRPWCRRSAASRCPITYCRRWRQVRP